MRETFLYSIKKEENMDMHNFNKLRKSITDADKETRKEFMNKIEDLAHKFNMPKLYQDVTDRCKIEANLYKNEVDCVFNTIEKEVAEGDALMKLIEEFVKNKK